MGDNRDTDRDRDSYSKGNYSHRSGEGEGQPPDAVVGRATSMSGQPGRVYSFGRGIAIRREKLGFSQHALARALRPVDRYGRLIEVQDPASGNVKGVDPTVVAKMELRSIPGRHRVYVPQLAKILWGTPDEIVAGFIPDAFPHQQFNVTGVELYSPNMTPGQKRAAVRVVLENANANLSALRELDPDALMTIASEAMRMKAELDIERRERERRAEEYSEGDFREQEESDQ